MKLLKSILICLSASILVSSVFVFTGCNRNNGEITQDGIRYSKVTLTEDGISELCYFVAGCEKNLQVLNIPAEINGLPVRSIKKEAFLNNTNLKEITLPDSITSISLFTAPFKGCTNIEKITSATTDIMNLFTDYGSADNNQEHTIPASVKYIYLSKGCTSITTREFYYCSNIREIHIPSTVTTIQDGTGSVNIGVNGNPPSPNAFKDLPFIGCTSLRIYCEVSSKPAGWGDYWNYINPTTAAPVVWGNYGL